MSKDKFKINAELVKNEDCLNEPLDLDLIIAEYEKEFDDEFNKLQGDKWMNPRVVCKLSMRVLVGVVMRACIKRQLDHCITLSEDETR